MKFSDMTYTRPNVDEAKKLFGDVTARIANAKTFDEADAAFLEYGALSEDVYTNASLCNVRHSINTEDEFYEKEIDYMDEVEPLFRELDQQASLTLFNSPFRKEFEAKYGSVFFKNIEISLKAFSPDIMPELAEENKLSTEYDKLLASAQIPFEGNTYTLSQLAPFKQNPDDARRLAAWKADAGFYVENGEKLDSIYDKMTKLRTKMAKKMGYKSFVELGYYRMNRNCYTAEDVAKFRKAVIEHLVPVADKLYREQAKRIGASYPLSYADMALSFRSGNPKPQGDADAILAQGKKFYHELSPETSEFIDFMYDNELLDVLSKKGKSGGGFCTDFPKYKSPFIFANFNGTQHDVEVMTHEAGHAFAAYTARNLPVMELRQPTLESCECHSMSMEFFAWPWAEGFFGKNTDKFLYSHLASALKFIPYGTMVDHFQHSVYERPEMTPAERHEEWKRLTGIYMPWVKLDGEIPFYAEGKAWQRQTHIYKVPFYYIDYCLAQTVSLQFWALMQHDGKDAWQRYLKFVNLAGTRTYKELVDAAGLSTPFGDTALKTVSEEALAWLNSRDTSKLV